MNWNLPRVTVCDANGKPLGSFPDQRFVVGAELGQRENARLAQRALNHTLVEPGLQALRDAA